MIYIETANTKNITYFGWHFGRHRANDWLSFRVYHNKYWNVPVNDECIIPSKRWDSCNVWSDMNYSHNITNDSGFCSVFVFFILVFILYSSVAGLLVIANRWRSVAYFKELQNGNSEKKIRKCSTTHFKSINSNNGNGNNNHTLLPSNGVNCR